MKALSTTLFLFTICLLAGFGCSSDPPAAPTTANSADCHGDASCTLGAACSIESDCRGSHCDRGTEKCVACLVNADCASGQDCIASTCLSQCQSDAQCTAGLHCSQSKHCQACAKDDQCAADEHCSNAACVADTCKKGVTDCDPDSNALRVCSPSGDGSRILPCSASKTCVSTDDGATCSSWICTPDSKSCDAEGKTARTCASDGLSFSDSAECKRGTLCLSGACVGAACTANHTFCSGNDSRSCASDGQSSVLLRACGDTALCEESTGLCRPRSCTPGSKMCDGQNVATCNANGASYDSMPCGLSQACSAAGTCQDLLCAPDEAFCDGNTLRTCNATGTAFAKAQLCSGTCTTTAGTYAYCTSKVCTPGAALCNGATATVCASDGSGPTPGGTDCASLNASCSSGQCVPHVCTPNQRFCDSNAIYQCSSNGDSSYYYGGCSTGTVCDPTTAACVAPTCSANAVGCNGSTVVKCDALGLPMATVQDCAGSGQTCSQGQCVSAVCAAYGTYCKSGNVWQCNSAGTGEELYQVCPSTTHCQGSYCATNTCVPGSAVCSGNSLSTCAADGSGPVSGGTPCAANQVCANGTCQAKLCTPYSYGCVGGDVYVCDSQGITQTLAQHCFSEAYCTNGTCALNVCPDGAAYCQGETLGTCLPDGSGPVSGSTTNCATSSKVCTTAGCVTSAVETIGSKKAIEYGYAMGQFLRVTTSRKLTRVQFDNGGSVDTPTVNTIIYSSTDGSNFYLLSSTAANAGAGTGYYDSGTLSVQLQAGSYYLIGVSGSTLLTAGRETPGSFQTLSFATSQKALLSLTSIATSFTPNQVAFNYHLILTTALP